MEMGRQGFVLLTGTLRQRPKMLRCCFKQLSVLTSAHPKVAVVGSGPAGFYTAQQIMKVKFS